MSSSSGAANDSLHDRVRTNRSEAERAFPPVEAIDSGVIRNATLDAIQSGVRDYFWTAPAASSYRHHNPYCCGERGLWIHTLMVSTAYERLVDSYVGQDLITKREGDLGRAAVLLHDFRKFGDAYESGESADMDHDLQAARWVRTDTDLPDEVADVVASHMGPWYEGPTPETSLQQLVHMADMAASTKNGTFGIRQKPDEIRRLYPSLPDADY